MAPQLNEIYLAKTVYKNCEDPRPCIILEILANQMVKVVLLSSNKDLQVPFRDFQIKASHPDFPETGLERNSYVLGDSFQEISVGRLGRRLGKLVGLLVEDFERWLG